MRVLGFVKCAALYQRVSKTALPVSCGSIQTGPPAACILEAKSDNSPVFSVRVKGSAFPSIAVQGFDRRLIVKWALMYFVGFVILIGGILAALWKLGILENIGQTWTVIGVVIAIGLGIMIAVSHSGTKENIQIDQK